MAYSKHTLRNCLLISGLAAIALFLRGIVILSQPREPQYAGKKLTEWLQSFDESVSNPVTGPVIGPFNNDFIETPEVRASQQAVRNIGTKALPYLLKMLSAKDFPLEQKARRLAASAHLTRSVLLSRTDLIQNRAIIGFAALGPSASPALPNLVDLIRQGDGSSPSAAAISLVQLGPAARPAIPALLDIARNGYGRNCKSAAGALWLIDPDAAQRAGVRREVLSLW
jgi:hypothetical protein